MATECKRMTAARAKVDKNQLYDVATAVSLVKEAATAKFDETVEIAFVADNPGIWMDHCHNLKHAAQGLVAHLMYSGVTDPYRLGGDSGNEPE